MLMRYFNMVLGTSEEAIKENSKIDLRAYAYDSTITAINTIASMPISLGATDRISPIRYLLYFVKLPPLKVAAKIPRATAILENTPISVSEA